MYADDITVFCIDSTQGAACDLLNVALKEIFTWGINKRLTPHPNKFEVMLLSKARLMGPLPAIYIGESIVEYKAKTRLLGVTVDQNLSWIPHLQEVVKSFANKLSHLKKSRFLPSHVCESFYLKVIQPSITYAMPVWGSVSQTELLGSLSIDDGDGSENVTLQRPSRFFKHCCVYSNPLKMSNVGGFP